MKNKQNYTNVLYIDDEIHNLNAFKASFRRNYNIFLAENTDQARKILDENEIHLIITDQRMPGMTGIEFLESVIENHPDPIRILLTGYADVNNVIDAINKGEIYKYIQKPWIEENLKMSIDKALEIYTLKRENRELNQKLIETNDKLEFLLRQKLLS